MYTIDELFSDKHEDGVFSDVLYEIDKIEYDSEALRKIFLSLPKEIQDVAYCWGLSDTVFCDDVYDYLEQHKNKNVTNNTKVSTADILDKIRERRTESKPSVVSPKPTVQDIKNAFIGREYQVGDQVRIMEDVYETEFRDISSGEIFTIETINDRLNVFITFDLINAEGERITVMPKDVEIVNSSVQDVITALRVSVNDPSVPAEQIMDQVHKILKAYANNETIPFEDY